MIVGMELFERDLAVIRSVGLFGQLSSKHIAELHFNDVSGTPLDRTLRRLVTGNHLRRVGRLIHGKDGRPGPYVYQVGQKAWRLVNSDKRFRADYQVKPHPLGVANTYIDLLTHERTGTIQLLDWGLEKTIGDARADLYVDLGIIEHRKRVKYFLEVDLSTESLKRIEEKAQTYIRAYQASQEEVFPYVAFLVPDDHRKDEIVRVLGRLGKERELFRCHLLSDGVNNLITQTGV